MNGDRLALLRLNRDAGIALALFALTAAAYAPTMGYEFVNCDDPDYVYKNPHVLGGISRAGLVWAFTAVHAGYWIPVTWMSFQLDATLSGREPAGYHLSNLVLHAANTALVYLLFRRMTGRVGRSVVVAALFALHPLHVESVAWVTERKDVLSGLFGLLALLAYLRYAAAPSRGRSAAVAICLGLGLAAKPMLVTWPFLFLVLDAWPLARLRTARDVGPLVREKFPLFVLAGAAAWLALDTQRRAGAVVEFGDLSPAARVAGAVTGYGWYLGKTLWPTDLALFYPAPAGGWSGWQPVAAGAVLAGVTVGAIRLRRRAPYLLAGWLWFVGTMFPVSGVAQAGEQAYADRFTYLPHLGLFLALVWGAGDLAARLRIPPRLTAAGAIAVLAACLVLTEGQLRYWANSRAVWERTLAVTGDNAFAHYCLGGLEQNEGHWDEALKCFTAACRLQPLRTDFQCYRANALLRVGREDEAAAAARTSLDLPFQTPEVTATARWVLGEWSRRRGLLGDAARQFELSLRAKGWAETHNSLGQVLAAQGRPADAARHFSAAHALVPHDAEVSANWGTALVDAGDYAGAVHPLEEAVRAAPDNAKLRGRLALALLSAGDTDGARRHGTAAARSDPRWLPGSDRAAWVLATHPDARVRRGELAVRLARLVCLVADPPPPEYLDTLAAAAAETGRFDEAVVVGERAGRAAEAAGRADLAAAASQRVEAYRGRRAYRASPAELAGR